MNDKYKKISETEIVIWTGLTVLVSLFCATLDAFGIGVAISPVIESFVVFGMWLFFREKGDPFANKAGANIVQYAATFIPFIPVLIATFLIKVIIHNSEKIAQLAGKTTGVATKL